MLVVTATIPIRPEAADLFSAAAIDLMRATRAEPGCVAYFVTVDPLDPSLVRMFELWEDSTSLRTHARAEHVATFLARTSEPRTGKTQVRIHDAEELSQETLRALFSAG